MTATSPSTPTIPAPVGTLVLTKYHGAGNDFVLLLDLDGSAPDIGPGTARRVCDRHLGIGADGLIRATRAGADRGAVLRFELWNADGSSAEMSGNGMRCLAQAALTAGAVEAGVPFGVVTPAGRREVTVRPTGTTDTPAGNTTGDTVWAVVEMGRALIEGETERCNVGHGHLLVDMGNPHLVVLGDDPAGVDVAALGPQLGSADPAGRNVEFVALGPGPDEVTMRVWERGVGETLACGTGACAAVLACHHWGRVGAAVTVHQPGGSVAVVLRPDGTVSLAGPSQRIATCWTSPQA
ncbi:MAG: diaminopimelate epimerase [Actinomycetota bacterium]|nr:diaminopimelate epimerase [Actinomycetota bacterium]